MITTITLTSTTPTSHMSIEITIIMGTPTITSMHIITHWIERLLCESF